MLGSLTGGGGLSSSTSSGAQGQTNNQFGGITMGDFMPNGKKSETSPYIIVGGLAICAIAYIAVNKKGKK